MSRAQDAIAKALRSVDGAKILAKLSQAAPIPGEGIVAGQSVASEIMRMLGISSRGPLNDVDVFLAEGTARGAALGAQAMASKEGGSPLSGLASHATRVGVEHWNGAYSSMFHATIKEGYLIRATAREGMLNEIAFRHLVEPVDSVGLVVARGFDLNCVQAAIDAATGELSWTPGFEKFLATFELRVANVNTPHHTAIRYFKKRLELGCLGDDELNMAVCALPTIKGAFEEPASRRSSRPGLSTDNSVAGRYGEKSHRDAMAHAADLAPWFSEIRAAARAKVWTMRPSFEGSQATLETLRRALDGGGRERPPRLWEGATSALLYAHAATFCEFHLRPDAPGAAARRGELDALERGMKAAGARGDDRAVVVDLGRARGADGAAVPPEAGAALASMLGDGGMLMAGALAELDTRSQALAALALDRRPTARVLAEAEWLADLRREPGGEARLHAMLRDPAAMELFLDAKVAQGSVRLAPPLDIAGQAGWAVRAAASILGARFAEANSPNEIRAIGSHVAGLRPMWTMGIQSGASRLFRVSIGGEPIDAAFEAFAPSGHGPLAEFSGIPRMFERRLSSLKGHEPASARARLACGMLAAAWGLDRAGQLLAIAPMLGEALDLGLVAPPKRPRAMALLAGAERGASEAMPQAKRIQRQAREALSRHFGAKELAASPKRDLAR